MWKVNLTKNPDHQQIQKQPAALNALTEITKPDLLQWYHATLFSPLHKNLFQAIKKSHFYTWLNLPVELIKHILPSVDTEKGHIKQLRKNTKSNKTPEKTPTEGEPMENLETSSDQVSTKIIYP